MTTSVPGNDPARLRFEMRQLLGSGSFGEVYLANMSSAGGIRQEVAVKILAQDLDPRSQPVERLRDEGRLLASLNHPVILQVRDLVLLKGRIGLVTEYVPGADLSRVLDVGGPLASRVALQILGHVADALDTAYHSLASDGKPMKLVHRDIKPANIRVTPHGTVKLLDFGIAKAQEPERETATSHVVLIGSLPYMAPEVLHMDVDDADMARDVFALGCTLFEALTNELYFVSLKRAELRQHSARPERYETWKASRLARIEDPTAGLREFLDELLAYAPGDRPTARQVADRAFELSDQASGPALRKWAKEFAWPADNLSTGAWTGRRVAETTMVPKEGYEGMRELEADEPSDVIPAGQGTFSVEAAVSLGDGALPSVAPAPAVTPPAAPAPRPPSAESTLPPPPPPVQTVRVATAAPVEEPASGRGLSVALVGAGVLGLLGAAGLALWASLSTTPTPVDAPSEPSSVAASEPAAAPAPAPAPSPAPVPSPAPAPSTSPASVAPTPAPAAAPASAPPRGATPAPTHAPVANRTTTRAPVTAATAAAPAVVSASAPTTSAPEPPAKGRIDVRMFGDGKVELRSGGKVASPGDSVAPGTWEIWADFGSGMALRNTTKVSPGEVVKLRCTAIMQVCE